MGAGPRITLISFVGVMVAAVAGLALWSAQPDYVLLYGGLSPEDAAAISGRLGDDKVPFRYEASRGAILVAATKADSAKLSLAALGLPRNKTEGFEIFDKTSFSTTEFVQHINFQRALSGTLERTIQSMEGVDTARVILTIPEDELFTREKKEAKASVCVKLRQNKSLNGEQIGAIRYLISSSVQKLEARNVTVTDSTGRLLSKPQEEGGTADLSDEQLGMQKNIENNLTNKVQSLLDQVLGAGQSAVRITAQLNLDRIERTSEKMDPASQVSLQETTSTDDTKGGSSVPAGVPGLASNTGQTPPVANAGATSNTKKQTSASTKYHYDTISERVIAPVGTIKRLSVSVLVASKSKPSDAAKGGAPEPQAVPRTPKELADLTEIVRSAVGFDVTRKDDIKIAEIPFSESAAAAAAPVAGIDWLELVQRHASDALAFAGILIMAFVFRRVFSRMPKIAPQPALQPQVGSTTFNAPSGGQTTVVLKDEMKQLVSKNNTQAADIIRTMLK